MKKIAIMTDSNSGITQKEAAGLGISVLPMPFMINDTTYFEDINLTQDRFYEFLENDAVVSTSQPSPDSLIHMFHKLLAEYDEVVHIPMSSGLSGSCQTACMLAQEPEFDGKVFVVNNQRISVTQTQSVLDAVELAKKGYDGAQIKKILEEDKFNSSIYIMLDTLFYLKKGGRITPAAAALGTLLKLKPVLQIQGEKLDAFAKARTKSAGKSMMLQAIKNDIENRFGGFDESAKERVTLHIAYTKDAEEAELWKQEVMEAFPGFRLKMAPLSLSVACHIGPGALALACTRNLIAE
ncbi:MAG TPA: DegV family protein [Lachnospiraceae bacterium]|nr:DegV family protein [Lachnospiraceae bacterium]HCX41882.1 DegV family protein [Lachnospiraceae bacterium]